MRNAKQREEWERTVADPLYAPYLVVDHKAEWSAHLAAAKAYVDRHGKAPSTHDADAKKLGIWLSSQRAEYGLAGSNRIVECDADAKAEWGSMLRDPRYARLLGRDQAPVAPAPTGASKKKQRALPGATALAGSGRAVARSLSAIGQLHKEYLALDPSVLHARFQAEPRLWLEYHATRTLTLAAYEPASLPSNRIIAELEKTRTSRRKLVVDMGCGEAPIARHFANDARFSFVSYDHHSGGDALITEADISAMPLADASAEIAIMSLAMWGPRESCAAYAREAHRVLESGGMFIVGDSTARWTASAEDAGGPAGLMRALLSERFRVVHEEIGVPFCLFVCCAKSGHR
jgi:hypothetical protein